MCKLRLYRGISNVTQLENILKNQTAGGWKKNDSLVWQDFNGELDSYVKCQKGTDGEVLPCIVEIDDTDDQKRCIVEYTFSAKKAKQFGKVGVICIEIENKYAETPNKNDVEFGIFCLSTAPVDIVHFEFCEKFYCHPKYNELKEKVTSLKSV